MSAVMQLPSSAVTRQAMNIAGIKDIAQKFGTTIVVYSIAYELDPDLLLEFSDFVDTRAAEVYIWVISPGRTIGFQKVELKKEDPSLADLVTDARFSIGARGRGGARGQLAQARGAPITPAGYPALQALNRILIAPVVNLLPVDPDTSLMILPQDLLYLVPFAALQDERGEFFVTRHAPFVNYSVAALPFESDLLGHASRGGRGVFGGRESEDAEFPCEAGRSTGSPATAARSSGERSPRHLGTVQGDSVAGPRRDQGSGRRAYAERADCALRHPWTHGPQRGPSPVFQLAGTGARRRRQRLSGCT